MTPTFRVIDKQTGREYSEKNINTDGLMTMDLYQMFLGEDGYLVMADDCDRIAYQDRERFDVVIDGYVAIDKVLEIIDNGVKSVVALECLSADCVFKDDSTVGAVARFGNRMRMSLMQQIEALSADLAEGEQYGTSE